MRSGEKRGGKGERGRGDGGRRDGEAREVGGSTVCLVVSWIPLARLSSFMAELAPCSMVFALWSPSIVCENVRSLWNVEECECSIAPVCVLEN